jgi:hypothetical protein
MFGPSWVPLKEGDQAILISEAFKRLSLMKLDGYWSKDVGAEEAKAERSEKRVTAQEN